MKFHFAKWNNFQKYDFKKHRSKSNLDTKICQFLYFICDVLLSKLSEVWQISFIIPHEVEIQDSLYQAKFSTNHYENRCK